MNFDKTIDVIIENKVYSEIINQLFEETNDSMSRLGDTSDK
jgi:hypothetical protein